MCSVFWTCSVHSHPLTCYNLSSHSILQYVIVINPIFFAFFFEWALRKMKTSISISIKSDTRRKNFLDHLPLSEIDCRLGFYEGRLDDVQLNFFLNHYFLLGHGPIRFKKILIKIKINAFFPKLWKSFSYAKRFSQEFYTTRINSKSWKQESSS